MPKVAKQSPWENVYWFARMLINSDKYGGVGTDSKTLLSMAGAVREALLDSKGQSEAKRLSLVKKMIREILFERWKNAAAKLDRLALLCEDLDTQLVSLDDVEVLLFTCESVIVPVNNALPGIPNDDRQFTEVKCRTYLSEMSEHDGLATVISKWDTLGERGSLEEERIAVVREFSRLRNELLQFTKANPDIVLSAFVQEFERRLSQKRKGRGGRSLEDVTSFLFDYYGIKAANSPEHFQADMEVDKWIKTSDGWLIGISCKRTLRERWKQVSSGTAELLGKFSIRQFWHVVTYDEDLSKDKLTLLGSQRHIFYLRDDSRILKHALDHEGLKNYVRPMSQFIQDIRNAQEKKKKPK